MAATHLGMALRLQANTYSLTGISKQELQATSIRSSIYQAMCCIMCVVSGNVLYYGSNTFGNDIEFAGKYL
jgi:hypothetical protein